jgi:Flp pilus assembly pilin Flp
MLGDNMVDFLKHLREETGQTMAEYAVVLGVITIAVVVTLGLLAGKISAVLGSVVSSM